MSVAAIATAIGLALATAAGRGGTGIVGTVPATLPSPSRVLWIAADQTPQVSACMLMSAQEWACQDVAPNARGVVVIVGDGGLAFVPQRVEGAQGAVMSWGRVVLVGAGGVAPADLHDLHITAWKPDRPKLRRQLRRFAAVQDPAVHVLRLSATVFWLCGRDIDRDAFVRVEGPATASHRIATASLADGPPDLPFFAELSAAFSLTGRVETRAGEGVEGADVELLEPLTVASGDGRQSKEDTPLIRSAKTRTAQDGTFGFEGLESHWYQVAATHHSLGRGISAIDTLAAPVVVKLIPLEHATGRVLRRSLPVVAARVRFVPDAAVWTRSLDPAEHVVEETYTDAGGRFALALPPQRAGAIQIIAEDGAIIRILVPPSNSADDIKLGDLTFPEPRHMTLRLVGSPACDLFATGPLGPLGLMTRRGTQSSNVYWFELPEAGAWAINADCGGRAYPLEPPVITIQPDGPDPILDVRLAQSGGDS